MLWRFLLWAGGDQKSEQRMDMHQVEYLLDATRWKGPLDADHVEAVAELET